MKRWLLLYDVVPDYLARRGEFRDEHLRLAQASLTRGELEHGGAFGSDFDDLSKTHVDGAVLSFRAETRDVAEAFAKGDPYVTNGVVTKWRVFEWKVVVGG